MPFQILHADITRLPVDAIVNAANPSLLGGGGVDGAIHRAAGPALREYCATLGGCAVGQAKRSPGFALPAKWVIHTVGPIWHGGTQGEEALLRTCYRNCLALALESGCTSVAFPLISAGAYGYPKEAAMRIAVQEIGRFLFAHEMNVTLTVFDRIPHTGPLFQAVQSYLDARLPSRCSDSCEAPQSGAFVAQAFTPFFSASLGAAAAPPACEAAEPPHRLQSITASKAKRTADEAAPCAKSLDERLRCLDESFSQMLLRKIDEKGISDAACYKRANVDRKLFSKIRSDPNYRPSKPTAIAFAIALELPLPEAQELLMKAGFALSHSNQFDVIIEYFLSVGNYDIFQINETLFAFDQCLLGA
ncbi:MAG: macro domain-containing protein [Oscillospiraceae bacterium]|nr:macro domain-containing protein [Oscillospiraceae bacterium]